MSTRRDLDAELVRRTLAASKSEAVELIESGRITVDGAPALKATRQVHAGQAINVVAPPSRYVGRGGFKLEAALQAFELTVVDIRALDVGASTGGFTDCLLQHGAREVVALDVGHSQLHERLRADSRVIVVERTNVRSVSPTDRGTFAFVCVDVSFISLRAIADALVALTDPGGDIVVLVKPQFEVPHEVASKGNGVIRDRAWWKMALTNTLSALDHAGAATMGVVISPMLGTEGNVEFLAWLRVGSEPRHQVDLDDVLDSAERLTGLR